MPIDLFNGFHFTMCVPFQNGNVLLRWLFPLSPHPPSAPFHLLLSSSTFIWFENDSVYACILQYIFGLLRAPECAIHSLTSCHSTKTTAMTVKSSIRQKRKNQKETCWTEGCKIGANANANEVFAQQNWWCTYIASMRTPNIFIPAVCRFCRWWAFFCNEKKKRSFFYDLFIFAQKIV